jgi:hypothetical protein
MGGRAWALVSGPYAARQLLRNQPSKKLVIANALRCVANHLDKSSLRSARLGEVPEVASLAASQGYRAARSISSHGAVSFSSERRQSASFSYSGKSRGMFAEGEDVWRVAQHW